MQYNQTSRKFTYILITINVLLFVITTFLGFVINSNILALDFLGGSVFQYILQGQIFRLVTANFLHANIFHILLNMYALYILGSIIENEYSSKALFVMYIFTAIAGSFVSFFINYLLVSIGFKDPNIYIVGVGASTALFGIMGFLLVSNYTFIDKQSLFNILFLNIFIGLVFSGIIDNWAHIGGIVGGMLLAVIDNLKAVLRKEDLLNFWFVASAVVFLASYIWLIIFNYYQIVS